MNKTQLAKRLSALLPLVREKREQEQHQTESEIAASLLWDAAMAGDLEGKRVADFGCGNGIFGIGALLLGAKKAYFIEQDADAIAVCTKNLASFPSGSYTVLEGSVTAFTTAVDTVLMNPPFGTKQAHVDKPFLEQAMNLGKTIYMISNEPSALFIRHLTRDAGWTATVLRHTSFPLRQKEPYHAKKVHPVAIIFWKITH